jgi:hypothetical protein
MRNSGQRTRHGGGVMRTTVMWLAGAAVGGRTIGDAMRCDARGAWPRRLGEGKEARDARGGTLDAFIICGHMEKVALSVHAPSVPSHRSPIHLRRT